MSAISGVFSDGEPCRAGVSRPDLAAGRRFYGELVGWTFEDQGAHFAVIDTRRRVGPIPGG
jgi:predicted enzyme related to lactoylglutathione lyase